MFNYSVDVNVENNIKKAVSLVNGNYEFVLASKFSQIEKDNYLYLVLAKGGYKEGSYVTWIYNDSYSALSNGHYDLDLKSALLDLSNRIS